jgi:acyl carrier protein
MEEKLRQIFQQSFDVKEIDNSMSIENVKGWDSMAHVGLMLALQKEFGVSISPAVAIELTDIAGIKQFLQKEGVE